MAYDLHQRAASLIADAGGELVGRTRLQKVAYLSQLAGYSNDFSFEYRHYGPFSEELADAMKLATGVRLVSEVEKATEWGAWYSVFSTNTPPNPQRSLFVAAAAKIGAIELELAATAAYLYVVEGYGRTPNSDPWLETARRKPDKAADGRLDRAKAAYRKLREVPTPVALPAIA